MQISRIKNEMPKKRPFARQLGMSTTKAAPHEAVPDGS